MEPGQEHRLREPDAGDPVAVGVRDALYEAVHAQPPRVIAHLPAGDGLGSLAGELRDERAQVAVGETVGQELEGAQGGEQGVRAQVTEPYPGTRVPGVVMTGLDMEARAPAPLTGSWLSRWACRRRRLAWKPMSARAGRLCSRLPMPKSRVSLMVVSVRSARSSSGTA